MWRLITRGSTTQEFHTGVLRWKKHVEARIVVTFAGKSVYLHFVRPFLLPLRLNLNFFLSNTNIDLGRVHVKYFRLRNSADCSA